jgi:CHAT domain-containing protein/Tfp pilus assembly protein PilF
MISIKDIRKLKSGEALKAFVKDHCGGEYEIFSTELNRVINRLLQSDLKQAARFISAAEVCYGWLPRRYQPRLLGIKARYAHYTGESEKALHIYRKAVEKLENVRDFEMAARTRQGLMDVYMYLGRYDKALQTGRLALAYFRRRGNEVIAARVMTNIGNVYHRLDRNRLALRYYDRARTIFKPQGGIPLAIVDFNRANIYTNLGKSDKAETLYKRAAEVYRENGLSIAAAKAEYSLAYLYFLDDRYTAALKTFDRVHEDFLKLGDQKAAAVTRLDLVEVNIHLNQYGSAVMLADQVMADFSQSGLRYEQAKAAYFAAEALRRLGDYDEVIRFLKIAKRLFQQEGNDLGLGLVHLTHSRLDLERGRYKKALEDAVQARSYFARSGDERRNLDARIALAEIRFKSGHPLSALRSARKLLDQSLAGYQLQSVFSLMGGYYQLKNQAEEALKYFRLAIEVAEKMLDNLYPDEVRFFFAIGRQHLYLSAVECLLRMGRVEESFLQHSRALAILNRRPLRLPGGQSRIPQKYLDTRARLRAALKKLSAVPESGQRPLAQQGGMSQIENRLWANERKIRALLYPSTAAKARSPQEIGDYRDLLRRGEILINYIPCDRRIGAFIADNDSADFHSCSVSTDELQRAVRELHFMMEKTVYAPGRSNGSADIINHYLARFYDWLIRPLGLERRGRKLILLVDGIFAQIPFCALKDNSGGWLKDSFDINLIVNPDDLRSDRQKNGLNGDKTCAIFAPGVSGLPMAEKESREIKEIFSGARLYHSDTATCAGLRQALAGAEGFVHIATHASRSSENPLFSKILMDDGPFFPFDLFETVIRSQLVSLSGCQTAAPGIYHGNSFSLAKAFYQGGARYVLASLWPISDKISRVFMVEFYRALKQKTDISVAYNTALEKTLSVNDNPAFWSPFVLLGV